MRTIVDLPDEQIRALDAYSKKHGVSRAEAVRRAIADVSSETLAAEVGFK